MPLSQDYSRLYAGMPDPVITVDSHTEGETTRLITGGVGPVPGDDMMAKLAYFKLHYDWVRCLVTKEPRGSRQVLAAMVTDPVSPHAAFGLIYMDARRYPYLCGHATIGAVVTLAGTGYLDLGEGETLVEIDTPSGVMTAGAMVENGNVVSVSIKMVPSFVFAADQEVHVAGFGTVPVDLVCTGGFFAMVDSKAIGIPPILDNKETLVDLGMKIIAAANEQLKVAHPENPGVATVDVTEFHDSHIQGGEARGRGMVVYGESHMDRSPCGTGTAAKLALLKYRGKLGLHQPYFNFSPLDTCFKSRLVEETRIGEFTAHVTEIQGMAWITGVHHFFLDKTDPFQKGYLI